LAYISGNFGENSLFKCASQPKIATKPAIYVDFMVLQAVIDLGTTGKVVGSACYDTLQVCVYLQPFSCYRRANSGEITIS